MLLGGRGVLASVAEQMELSHLMERRVDALSGGELQRFAIALTCVQDAKLYIVDEPSSFLDIRQRLRAARALLDLRREGANESCVIVVEHDIAVLDYLADMTVLVLGKPGRFGFCSVPYQTGVAVNHYFAGILPHMGKGGGDLSFRSTALSFGSSARVFSGDWGVQWPAFSVRHGQGFQLDVEAGAVGEGEIVLLLGQNGSGKTTFLLRLIEGGGGLPHLRVAHKAQDPREAVSQTGRSEQTVAEVVEGLAGCDETFTLSVVEPLVGTLMRKPAGSLSGGEMQRLSIVLALAQEADGEPPPLSLFCRRAASSLRRRCVSQWSCWMSPARTSTSSSGSR